jgi:DNA polymerase-3 subunit alpha
MRYPSDQFFMKSPQQMYELFREFPEALKNTTLIASAATWS